MSESSQLAVRPKASQQLAQLIGMQPEAMLDTIKAQCFKTNPANVTNEQLAAFVSIAADMGVNPLLPGMLYAYPISGGGIIPIMGPDGIYKKLSEREDIVSWETEVFPPDVALPPTHATTKIWRTGRDKPISYTALLSEWKVTSNPNWNTRPRHMLALRSLKHAARQIIHGLPGDEDDRHIAGEINVTGTAEGAATATEVKRADAPARNRKEKGVSAAAGETGKAIDIETVPPKPDTAPADTAPVATKTEKEIAAEKAAALKAADEKPAEKPVEKVTEKPVEKPTEKPVASGPRTELKEDEEITVKVTVKKVFALMIAVAGVKTPSVQATVEGGFTGTVFEFNGATQKESGLVPNPEWKEGAVVSIVLWGRLNKTSLKVMPVVRKITVEGSADTPIDVG